MKNSIFKKIVSVIAVTAITITSSVAVLAENDYASQSTDCSSGTNWGLYTDTGISATRVNEEIKVERTIFRVKNSGKAAYQGLEEATALSDGYVYFAAGEDGNWEAVETASANPTWTYNFADSKSFSKGRVQIKGDIKFDGGVNQTASIDFSGSTSVSWERLGVLFGKTGMRPLWPNGTPGAYTNYPETIENGTWYTFTIVYDIDRQTIDYTIQKKNDAAWSATGAAAIPSTVWTASRQKGAVRGMTFATYRDYDTADATSTDYKSSVWYLDNVELDAYTETNYALSTVYRNSKGVETNKAAENFPLQGFLLSRFTGVKDPASVSLVTASYDTDTRMIDAVTTPVSTIGATPVLQEVEEGDTVKNFILDMNNARPYTPVYQYAEPETTYRKLDFDEGCSIPGWQFAETDTKLDTTYYYAQIYAGATPGVTLTTVNDTADNKVMKVERSVFKNKATWDSTNNVATTGSTPSNGYFGLKLDKEATNLTVSFRFKFAGVDNANGNQVIGISTGETDGTNPLIRIARDENGNGRVWCYFAGGGVAYTDVNGPLMLTDTWYDFSYTIDLTGKTLTTSLSGEFSTGYETKGGEINLATITPAPTLKSSISMLKIGSPAEYDRAFTDAELTTATEFDTKTSVFYIDDLKVEYR